MLENFLPPAQRRRWIGWCWTRYRRTLLWFLSKKRYSVC